MQLCGVDLSGVILEGARLSGANLNGANLSDANLRDVNLSDAEIRGANLVRVNLSESILISAQISDTHLTDAILSRARLGNADLSCAELRSADLSGADLTGTNLSNANLSGVDLNDAILSRANLTGADVRSASLVGTILQDTDLRDADLRGANLRDADLTGANFNNATLGWTALGRLNLAVARSLEQVKHLGPSTLGLDTLAHSGQGIPTEFLRGCGLTPWEILQCRMYDEALTPHEISELQIQIFDKRTHGPLFIAGVFISYSHADSDFVDRIHKRLQASGFPVWLDRHDLLAGDLQKQVARAIRLQDVVVLVLSENSIRSDWVENELEMARNKEKEHNRDVLCPLALDDSWKSKLDHTSSNRALWRTLPKKTVLDFSAWDSDAFDEQFRKLARGLKLNY
jgi:uncharacterized protein YjbI with pentapeptide repeats